jgi:hypothetical protein
MQKRNQFSGAFLLSVTCGDMQVHAAVMCARKACQFFECSLMHRRKYPCGSSWGSGCRSAVVKSCSGSRAPICALPECWHPRDRVPRDVDVVYRPNWTSWGDGPYGVLAELLRDACEDKKEMTGANDTSQLAEAEVQRKKPPSPTGPSVILLHMVVGRSFLLSLSSSSRHLDKCRGSRSSACPRPLKEEGTDPLPEG